MSASGAAASGPTGGTRVYPGATSLAGLQKGMTAAQVRAVLGEPDDIKPFKVPDVGTTVWTYRRTIRGPIRQVVTTVRESPYIDPLTGQSRTIREPVYGQEMSYFHETIELLMNGDSLLEWKRSVREEQIRH